MQQKILITCLIKIKRIRKEVINTADEGKINIPQQGSQKSRKKSGIDKDPGTKETDFKKHWNKNGNN